MKKNIFLLGLLSLSVGVFGQSDVQFYNQGTVYVGGDTQAATLPSLYVDGSVRMEGSSSVHQVGKSVLTGDLINNVSTGNVFGTVSGSLEFRGTGSQRIYGSADKATNYINLPDQVIINNQNTDSDSVVVVLDALMGASAKNITLTRGRLVLDSKVSDARSSHVAHLLVKTGGNIGYNRNTSLAASEEGIIQVNLALGDNHSNKRVVGFTPPFKKIYADYLLFNFMSEPNQSGGLFGKEYGFIMDPYTPMTGGRGYIIGQGIIEEGNSYYTDKWDPQFVGAAFQDRVKEVLHLGRRFAPTTLTQFVETAGYADRFSGESLNITDVSVTLERGFNYIGNPFTVPLDMTGFVTNTGSVDDWGVSRSADGSGDVRNSFYVLSQGQGSYHPENTYSKFKLNVSYLLGQGVGGTLTYAGGYSSLLIAPMQMFVVGRDASSNKTMTIPASARSHGNSKYLRSVDNVYDEILIETRDQTSGGYDRLCVVFREDASLNATDDYDATKIFNTSGGVNQIYTQSSEGKSMTTNVIHPSTRSLPLYFEPNNESQEVELEAYRLQSLSAVSMVTLEDRKLRTETSLLSNPVYRFTSDPNDNIDRFVLHFTRGTVNIEEEESTTGSIYAHYQGGVIRVQGLDKEDTGSHLTLVDLQGHELYRGTITDTPVTTINQNLPTGIYILKLSGVRQSVHKLSVK